MEKTKKVRFNVSESSGNSSSENSESSDEIPLPKKKMEVSSESESEEVSSYLESEEEPNSPSTSRSSSSPSSEISDSEESGGFIFSEGSEEPEESEESEESEKIEISEEVEQPSTQFFVLTLPEILNSLQNPEKENQRNLGPEEDFFIYVVQLPGENSISFEIRKSLLSSFEGKKLSRSTILSLTNKISLGVTYPSRIETKIRKSLH